MQGVLEAVWGDYHTLVLGDQNYSK
jgi:hypothetical protein